MADDQESLKNRAIEQLRAGTSKRDVRQFLIDNGISRDEAKRIADEASSVLKAAGHRPLEFLRQGADGAINVDETGIFPMAQGAGDSGAGDEFAFGDGQQPEEDLNATQEMDSGAEGESHLDAAVDTYDSGAAAVQASPLAGPSPGIAEVAVAEEDDIFATHAEQGAPAAQPSLAMPRPTSMGPRVVEDRTRPAADPSVTTMGDEQPADSMTEVLGFDANATDEETERDDASLPLPEPAATASGEDRIDEWIAQGIRAPQDSPTASPSAVPQGAPVQVEVIGGQSSSPQPSAKGSSGRSLGRRIVGTLAGGAVLVGLAGGAYQLFNSGFDPQEYISRLRNKTEQPADITQSPLTQPPTIQAPVQPQEDGGASLLEDSGQDTGFDPLTDEYEETLPGIHLTEGLEARVEAPVVSPPVVAPPTTTSPTPVAIEAKPIVYQDGRLTITPAGFGISTYAAAIVNEGADSLAQLSADEQNMKLKQYASLKGSARSDLRPVTELTTAIVNANPDNVYKKDLTAQGLKDASKNVVYKGVALSVEYKEEVKEAPAARQAVASNAPDKQTPAADAVQNVAATVPQRRKDEDLEDKVKDLSLTAKAVTYNADTDMITVSFVLPGAGASRYAAMIVGEGLNEDGLVALSNKDATTQRTLLTETYTSEGIRKLSPSDPLALPPILDVTVDMIEANKDKVGSVDVSNTGLKDGKKNVVPYGAKLTFKLPTGEEMDATDAPEPVSLKKNDATGDVAPAQPARATPRVMPPTSPMDTPDPQIKIEAPQIQINVAPIRLDVPAPTQPTGQIEGLLDVPAQQIVVREKTMDELMGEYVIARGLEDLDKSSPSGVEYTASETLALLVANKYRTGDTLSKHPHLERVELAAQLAVTPETADPKQANTYMRLTDVANLVNEGQADRVSIREIRKAAKETYGKTRVDARHEAVEDRRNDAWSAWQQYKANADRPTKTEFATQYAETAHVSPSTVMKDLRKKSKEPRQPEAGASLDAILTASAPTHIDVLAADYFVSRDADLPTGDTLVDLARSYKADETGLFADVYTRDQRLALAAELAVTPAVADRNSDAHLSMRQINDLVNEGLPAERQFAPYDINKAAKDVYGKTRWQAQREVVDKRRQEVWQAYTTQAQANPELTRTSFAREVAEDYGVSYRTILADLRRQPKDATADGTSQAFEGLLDTGVIANAAK